MKKYVTPKITEREVIVNNFLSRNPYTDPFSDFSGYFQIGSVYAQSVLTPKPPSTGTAGMKDEKISKLMQEKRILDKF